MNEPFDSSEQDHQCVLKNRHRSNSNCKPSSPSAASKLGRDHVSRCTSSFSYSNCRLNCDQALPFGKMSLAIAASWIVGRGRRGGGCIFWSMSSRDDVGCGPTHSPTVLRVAASPSPKLPDIAAMASPRKCRCSCSSIWAMRLGHPMKPLSVRSGLNQLNRRAV